MAAVSIFACAPAAKAADYLTSAERAALERRRDAIENDDFGHTRHGAERRRLDAILSPIDCPLKADHLRIACGLPALDDQRSRAVEALASLHHYAPGATHGPLSAAALADLPVSIPSTFDPMRHYAFEREARAAEYRAWAVQRLSEALAWLASETPLTVLSRDDDAEGGPVARVALYRSVELAVAA